MEKIIPENKNARMDAGVVSAWNAVDFYGKQVESKKTCRPSAAGA
jgi:hypothetical protein